MNALSSMGEGVGIALDSLRVVVVVTIKPGVARRVFDPFVFAYLPRE